MVISRLRLITLETRIRAANHVGDGDQSSQSCERMGIRVVNHTTDRDQGGQSR